MQVIADLRVFVVFWDSRWCGLYECRSLWGSDQLSSDEHQSYNKRWFLKEYSQGDLKFGFRHSIFQEQKLGVIVEAKFRCIKGDVKDIVDKLARHSKSRREYQEWTHPNLGSAFVTFDIYREIRKGILCTGLLFYLIGSIARSCSRSIISLSIC